MVKYVCWVLMLISLIANVFFACGYSRNKTESFENDSLPKANELLIVTKDNVNS